MPVVNNSIVGYDNRDWYAVLVEDCKAIITESVFNSRWALIEGYHHLGERIVTDENYQKAAKGNHSSLSGLSKNIGIGERNIYRAIQFYDKYPSLDALPDGKNISWNKIVTQYLPATNKPDKPAWVYRWDSMKRLASLLVDDTEAPDKIRKVCKEVLRAKPQ